MSQTTCGHDKHKREFELQHAAENRDRKLHADAAESKVARYRFIYHILQHEVSSPPANFAAQMDRLVQDQAEDSTVEAWVLRIMAIITLLALWPAIQLMGSLWPAISSPFMQMPWNVIVMVGASLSFAWIADRMIGALQRHHGGGLGQPH